MPKGRTGDPLDFHPCSCKPCRGSHTCGRSGIAPLAPPPLHCKPRLGNDGTASSTAILALLFIALRRVTRLCIEARDLQSALLGLWRSEVLASPMGFLACVLALLGRRANIAAPRRKVAQVILWTSIRVPVSLVVAGIHVVEVALHRLPLLPFIASLV